MTLQTLVDEVAALEGRLPATAAGDPALDEIIARIGQLRRELTELRGLSEPLVPDAQRPLTSNQKSEAYLDSALKNLQRAAEAKRGQPPPS
jgi:hypothetical protein